MEKLVTIRVIEVGENFGHAAQLLDNDVVVWESEPVAFGAKEVAAQRAIEHAKKQDWTVVGRWRNADKPETQADIERKFAIRDHKAREQKLANGAIDEQRQRMLDSMPKQPR